VNSFWKQEQENTNNHFESFFEKFLCALPTISGEGKLCWFVCFKSGKEFENAPGREAGAAAKSSSKWMTGAADDENGENLPVSSPGRTKTSCTSGSPLKVADGRAVYSFIAAHESFPIFVNTDCLASPIAQSGSEGRILQQPGGLSAKVGDVFRFE
jgi:hypothetical protein